MIRAGLIGVGKMGISHYAILGAHPRRRDGRHLRQRCVYDVGVAQVHGRRDVQGLPKDDRRREARLRLRGDADVDLTSKRPSYALEHGLHVFVEKPLCLDPVARASGLPIWRRRRTRANQVGYHNRFIGTFRETAAARAARARSATCTTSAERAFGQVVIRPKSGSTWRSKKAEGGGCLHDYASHVVDLMNFIVGPPEEVLGAHAPHLLEGRRGRGVRHVPLPKRRERQPGDQLERRDLPEDEHYASRCTEPRGRSSSTDRSARSTCVRGPSSKRIRPAGPPATSPICRRRWRSTCAARNTPPRSTRSWTRSSAGRPSTRTRSPVPTKPIA